MEDTECNHVEPKTFMKHFKVRQEKKRSLDKPDARRARERRNSLPVSMPADVKSMQTHFKLMTTLRSKRRKRSKSVDYSILEKDSRNEDVNLMVSFEDMLLDSTGMQKFSTLVEAGM